MRISAMLLLRQLAGDGVADHAGEQHREGVAVDVDRPGLHQHHEAQGDHSHGAELPRSAAEKLLQTHLRIAPKVMPRSRCLRNSTVKNSTGSKNSVVPEDLAGQSRPPSAMMVGMNGGEVCAG